MKNPTKKILERLDKTIPGSSGILYDQTRKLSKKNKSYLDLATGLFQWAENNSSAKLKKRKPFSKLVQRQVREYQQNKCMICGKKSKHLEFHQRDGNHSNNSPENCEGLCLDCHADKHRKN